MTISVIVPYAHIEALPSVRQLSQAHQLAMSLNIIIIIKLTPTTNVLRSNLQYLQYLAANSTNLGNTLIQ